MPSNAHAQSGSADILQFVMPPDTAKLVWTSSLLRQLLGKGHSDTQIRILRHVYAGIHPTDSIFYVSSSGLCSFPGVVRACFVAQVPQQVESHFFNTMATSTMSSSRYYVLSYPVFLPQQPLRLSEASSALFGRGGETGDTVKPEPWTCHAVWNLEVSGCIAARSTTLPVIVPGTDKPIKSSKQSKASMATSEVGGVTDVDVFSHSTKFNVLLPGRSHLAPASTDSELLPDLPVPASPSPLQAPTPDVPPVLSLLIQQIRYVHSLTTLNVNTPHIIVMRTSSGTLMSATGLHWQYEYCSLKS